MAVGHFTGLTLSTYLYRLDRPRSGASGLGRENESRASLRLAPGGVHHFLGGQGVLEPLPLGLPPDHHGDPVVELLALAVHRVCRC